MGRARRTYVPGISAHLIQRGNNRQPIFSTDVDYRVYLDLLAGISTKHDVAIHSFALMTNHYHLLATPERPESIPAMMQSVNGRYVRHYNRRCQRIGTLWTGRYRSIAIDDERYWLSCLRYIDLNPLRAGLTDDLAHYPWSSYGAHVGCDKSAGWLAPHPTYLALGSTDRARQLAYRRLCEGDGRRRPVAPPTLISA